MDRIASWIREHFRIDPIMRDAVLSSVVISVVAAMHFYQAALTLVYPAASKATAVLALVFMYRTLDAPDGLRFMACSMILWSLLALYGTLFQVRRYRIPFLLPQHIMLTVQAFGGIAATLIGRYLDGTIIPWPHISADQAAFLGLMVIHWYAIFSRFRDVPPLTAVVVGDAAP